MKSNTLSAWRRSLGTAGALLILGSLTAVGDQRFNPVGLTWDCLLSGSGQQGIAFLTFSNDFTFTGYQLLVSKHTTSGGGSGSTTATDQRNSGGDTGRSSGSTTDSSSAGGGTNLFGFGPVSGPWRYDEKGRVVGYFTEKVSQGQDISQVAQTTVQADFQQDVAYPDGTSDLASSAFSFQYQGATFATNINGSAHGLLELVSPYSEAFALTATGYGVFIHYTVINSSGVPEVPLQVTNFLFTVSGAKVTTNIQWSALSQDGLTTNTYTQNMVFTPEVTSVSVARLVTNSVSFAAKGTSGKRVSLVSSTPSGKVTYKGVPQAATPSLIGSWQGALKKDKQTTLELFNLLPVSLDNPYVPGPVANIYFTTNGNGPNVVFGGLSMVSVQRKIGFAFESFNGAVTNISTASGGTLSATVGPISYPKKAPRADTKGIADPNTPIRFQAVRQSP